jgi:hypothetical protein
MDRLQSAKEELSGFDTATLWSFHTELNLNTQITNYNSCDVFCMTWHL